MPEHDILAARGLAPRIPRPQHRMPNEGSA